MRQAFLLKIYLHYQLFIENPRSAWVVDGTGSAAGVFLLRPGSFSTQAKPPGILIQRLAALAPRWRLRSRAFEQAHGRLIDLLNITADFIDGAGLFFNGPRAEADKDGKIQTMAFGYLPGGAKLKSLAG
ncbi:hypothetical protein [Pseudomonas fluorescens]|uniref:Uncharacterized protein n=1 Tax=Pseudomonas fluorescens TaxID=294 RepID=A0A5E7CW73_PSEFL|nr:hypothetical protein [Pseudomonas fluorescens]VVN99773.1 hypothetical protein PS691_02535 [Pseudomonas fluorescens]